MNQAVAECAIVEPPGLGFFCRAHVLLVGTKLQKENETVSNGNNLAFSILVGCRKAYGKRRQNGLLGTCDCSTMHNFFCFFSSMAPVLHLTHPVHSSNELFNSHVSDLKL